MRRRVDWPLWAVLLAMFAVLVVGVAIGGAGTEDEDSEVATATTVAPANTTEGPPPVAPTATTTPRTTPPPAATSPPVDQASFQSVFDNNRARVLADLEADDNIQSVDKFVYDAGRGSVVLDVTSTWASPDNQEEGAWEITRSVASYWEPGSGAFTTPSFTPGFVLVNSGRQHACDSAFMLRLARTEAGRGDWATACR